MNSNNKLEVKDSKDIQVLNLIEGDIASKPKEKEFVLIAGRQQVINRNYGSFKLNEEESKSYHDWDKTNDIIMKEAEEFMKDSADTQGLTYSGKNKIPYGIRYDKDGGMTITPMPEKEKK